MPDIQISGLNPTPGLAGTDQFATKKGAEDFRATLDQISQYIIDNDLDAQTILDRLKTVDTDTSGLNANFLQGLTSSYFRNASNLNAGIVPDLRLPQGSLTENFIAGGNWGTGRNGIAIPFPSFITGGVRLLVQFGYSNYTFDGGTITITFPQAFASGWGSDNKPLVILSPECRRDLSGGSPWNNDSSAGDGRQNIELDMRLWYSDLTKARCSSIRTRGSEGDTVRANWLAIGKY